MSRNCGGRPSNDHSVAAAFGPRRGSLPPTYPIGAEFTPTSEAAAEASELPARVGQILGDARRDLENQDRSVASPLKSWQSSLGTGGVGNCLNPGAGSLAAG